MGATIRVEVDIDGAGLVQLLNDQGVAGACKEAADRIAAAAGDGFHVTREYHPGSRVMYRVYGDADGNVAEADEKKLSRAVSACRS